MLKFKNKGLVVLFILGILYIISSNYGMWTDEIYTMNMISKSYNEIIRIENSFDGTVIYFIGLKFFLSMFSFSNYKDMVIYARLFSFIPMVILLFIGSYRLSKLYDKDIFSYFVLGIFVYPIIYYSYELRTYSWCILFSTLSFIEFLSINKTYDSYSWSMFVFNCILSFYFHKTSVIPSFLMFLFLFIKAIKDKKFIKFFKYSLITFIFCLPIVLYTILFNINKLDETYIAGAILPVFSINKFKETLIFPFNTGNLYISLSFLCFYIFICLRYVIKKVDLSILYGVIILPITCIILMLMAYFGNHDYYPKYMLASVGIFFVSLIIMIYEDKFSRYLFYILLSINIFSLTQIINSENNAKLGFNKFETYIANNLTNSEVIVSNFDYGKYLLEYYRFSDLNDNKIVFEEKYSKQNDNRVYFIQKSRLNVFFEDINYIEKEEFNISGDIFVLCYISN